TVPTPPVADEPLNAAAPQACLKFSKLRAPGKRSVAPVRCSNSCPLPLAVFRVGIAVATGNQAYWGGRIGGFDRRTTVGSSLLTTCCRAEVSSLRNDPLPHPDSQKQQEKPVKRKHNGKEEAGTKQVTFSRRVSLAKFVSADGGR
ncbi:MAG: hypothetical protein SLRJCFUN_000301, partial [Candidatus Fervidibacter sp.]